MKDRHRRVRTECLSRAQNTRHPERTHGPPTAHNRPICALSAKRSAMATSWEPFARSDMVRRHPGDGTRTLLPDMRGWSRPELVPAACSEVRRFDAGQEVP